MGANLHCSGPTYVVLVVEEREEHSVELRMFEKMCPLGKFYIGIHRVFRAAGVMIVVAKVRPAGAETRWGRI
jgi:hypothetical protein